MISYSEKIKAAELLYKVANEMDDKNIKKNLCNQICYLLTGTVFLDNAPQVKETPNNEILFTATEIGEMFNVSPAKIGKIANDNNLKIPQNGIWICEKAKYSNDKKFWTFKYNNKGVLALMEILNR